MKKKGKSKPRSGGGFRSGTKGNRGAFAREVKAEMPIDYKNVEMLAKGVGSQGQILSSRRTGLNTKRQRELKIAIKRARHMSLMAFVG